MRILGGDLKGRTIPRPKWALRPTSALVREALMSMLGPDWNERSILDCFSGTGAFGFEAISRGASDVVFIDNNPAVISHLRNASESLGVEGQATYYRGDAETVLKRLKKRGDRFDILFFDPPYYEKLLDSALVLAHGLASSGAQIVAEHAPTEEPLEQLGEFVIHDRRRYGGTVVTVYREPSQ